MMYETGLFEAAEPDIMVDNLFQCTNDSLFESQWGLMNTGQYGDSVGTDIKYCFAHQLTGGDSTVIVAVLDTGIDSLHPDMLYVQPYHYLPFNTNLPN